MAPKSDLRKIRFANLDGISRDDIPLANEIWVQDVFRAPWATQPMMKLAMLFVRYMNTPGMSLNMGDLEITCQISADEVRKTLVVMRGFGAIDSFQTGKVELQVALNLSLLQRLAVLETRRRFTAVLPGAQRIWTQPGETWVAGKQAAA
jgi:hypothetical protein